MLGRARAAGLWVVIDREEVRVDGAGQWGGVGMEVGEPAHGAEGFGRADGEATSGYWLYACPRFDPASGRRSRWRTPPQER